MRDGEGGAGRAALVGDIGRKRLCFALTDAAGQLRADTIRRYDAQTTATVTGALQRFQADAGLAMLPERAGIAVAGMTRGEAVSITRSRLIVSRTGLTAMFGRPPLLVNDGAAQAWALADDAARPQEVFAGPADLTTRRPGCYCLVGANTGLGVAVLVRDEGGGVTVLPTEAGHAALASPSREQAELVAMLFPDRHPVPAEELVSATGLLAIYAGLHRRQGTRATAASPEDVTARIATDPVARQACVLLARALWAQAGSLVLAYGAWDGVFLTGKLAGALRAILRQPDVADAFALPGKYQRLLATVPRALAGGEAAELRGAAEALRHRREALPPLASAA